jgi:putative chitinase
MQLYQKYKTLFNSYQMNNPLRIAHFMSQIEHESGLKAISENLNYSKSGLLKTFGKYFTEAKADEYARNPEKIANVVYANRMGNGDECSGEGWEFRGRGFIQLTGKSNYIVLSKDTRIDYVENPDWLLREPDAMIAALWFWNKNKLNLLADKDDAKAVTRKINGGYNGLKHRLELLSEWKLKLENYEAN